jgi:DNA-binding transcriptional ArsR family regulator
VAQSLATRETVGREADITTSDPVRLDRVFGALADPTRRAILAQLAGGEATVGDVAEPLRMALPSVSKHVRVLERSGLIARRVDGRRHWLRLSPEGLRRAADFIDFYRPFWEQSVDRLASLTTELARSTATSHTPGPTPGHGRGKAAE